MRKLKRAIGILLCCMLTAGFIVYAQQGTVEVTSEEAASNTRSSTLASLKVNEATVHVNQNAAANGDGSEAAPYRTLNEAMNGVPDNGIIILHGIVSTRQNIIAPQKNFTITGDGTGNSQISFGMNFIMNGNVVFDNIKIRMIEAAFDGHGPTERNIFVNGYHLTINDNVDFENNSGRRASIFAGGQDSSVEITGRYAQLNINSGDFFIISSGKVKDGVTINLGGNTRTAYLYGAEGYPLDVNLNDTLTNEVNTVFQEFSHIDNLRISAPFQSSFISDIKNVILESQWILDANTPDNIYINGDMTINKGGSLLIENGYTNLHVTGKLEARNAVSVNSDFKGTISGDLTSDASFEFPYNLGYKFQESTTENAKIWSVVKDVDRVYVNGVSGLDSNTGEDEDHPLLTLQAAFTKSTGSLNNPPVIEITGDVTIDKTLDFNLNYGVILTTENNSRIIFKKAPIITTLAEFSDIIVQNDDTAPIKLIDSYVNFYGKADLKGMKDIEMEGDCEATLLSGTFGNITAVTADNVSYVYLGNTVIEGNVTGVYEVNSKTLGTTPVIQGDVNVNNLVIEDGCELTVNGTVNTTGLSGVPEVSGSTLLKLGSDASIHAESVSAATHIYVDQPKEDKSYVITGESLPSRTGNSKGQILLSNMKGWKLKEQQNGSVYEQVLSKKTFNVNFEDNGATDLAPVSTTVTYEEKLNKPASPIKTGYTFVGWYQDEACTIDYDFEQPVTSNLTLYAKWTAGQVYVITYELNGGYGIPLTTEAAPDAYIMQPSNPLKSGYNFAGWFVDETLATVWTFDVDKVTANTILYAKWEPQSFTITYELNGGTGSPASVTGYYNTPLVEPTTPNKTGYTFRGWYKDSNFINRWDFTKDVAVNAATLYAKWEKNVYTVTLDANGGAGAPASIPAAYESLVTRPNDPIMDEARFDGWYQDSAFQTIWDFSKDKVTEDITLYAKWIKNTYTVTFDLNGGSGTVDPQTITCGEKATLPANDLSKTGYKFGGWYQDADLKNEWDFDVDTITADTRLYAKWNIESYTVTLNANGGTGVPASLSVTYDSLITDLKTEPTYQGHKFLGWYLGDTKWELASDKVTENIILDAKWEAETYKITYVNNDGTGASSTVDKKFGDKLSKPADPIRENYKFAGWYIDEDFSKEWKFDDPVSPDTVSGDTTLYAKWEADTFTITYDSQGGTKTPEAVTAAYDSYLSKPDDPVREGFTFGGWYQDSACTKPWGFTSDKVKKAMTLYAKWDSGDTYTVTFELNGGTGISTTAKVEKDTVIKDPGKPTKTNYTFAGWYQDSTLLQKWDFLEKITGPVTLYAKWAPVKYKVTYDMNGGSGADISDDFDYNSKLTKPSDPARTGYEFSGWYTDAVAGVLWDFDFNVVERETILYARWNKNIYTVNYVMNGGIGTTADDKVYYGDKLSKPADPTRENYKFAGWYIDADFSKEWKFDDPVSSNMTLYAKWEADIFTITYDSQGGTGTPITVKAAYDSLLTQPDEPTRLGYNFDGWYQDVDYKVVWDFTNHKVSGDTTLYAKWSKMKYKVTFALYGGYGIPEIKEIEYHEKITDLKNPERIGYEFDGWYKDDKYQSPWNFDTDIVTTEITLHAKWKINTYTVTFDRNGGSGSLASAIVPYDSVIKDKPADPTYPGYEFQGWYKDNSFSEAWDFNIDKVMGDTTLYAKWEKKKYSVTYVLNDEEGTSSNVSAEHGTKLEESKPIRTGYTFHGWYKDSNLQTPWNFTSDIVEKAITLYAKWTINTYDVIFHSNGGSPIASYPVAYGKQIVRPNDPIKENYVFEGWYQDEALQTPWNFMENKIIGPLHLYAKYIKQMFTLTLHGEGGSFADSKDTSEVTSLFEDAWNGNGKLPVPRRRAYVFEGWYTEKDGAGTRLTGDEKASAHMDAYAKWREAKVFTLHLSLDGDENLDQEVQAYEGAPFELEPEASEGYTFSGWYLDAEKTRKWDPEQLVEEEVTLYAGWDQIVTYITLDANGGIFLMRSSVIVIESKYWDAWNKEHPFPEVIKPGYELEGWYTEKDGKGTRINEDSVSRGDVEVYANWVIPKDDDKDDSTNDPIDDGNYDTDTITPSNIGKDDDIEDQKQNLVKNVITGDNSHTEIYLLFTVFFGSLSAVLFYKNRKSYKK